MRSYRLYRLAADGHIQSGEWIEADSDEAALLTAKHHAETLATICEVWDGARRIGRLEPVHS